MRAYKTVNDAYIEPVSFVVPRRAEVFQGDIYPPATGSKPAVSAEQYFAGQTGLPPKISLESLYEGHEPQEIPAEKAPSAAEVKQSPAPAVTSSSKTDPQVQRVSAPSQPEPATVRSPPPSSMNDSKQSMASLASRFADKDEDEETDDNSSFEEIPKPVHRNHQIISEKQEEKTGTVTPPQLDSKPAGTTVSSDSVPRDAHRSFSGESIDTPAKATSVPVEQLSQRSATESEATSSPSTGAKGAAEGIKGMLQEIRALLSEQGKQVAQQGEKIEILAREVAALKSKVGE